MKLRKVYPILALTHALCFGQEPSFHGVWEGAIGQSKIVACFESDESVASYFYTKYLTPIRLYKSADQWREEGGVWLIKIKDKAIEGTWKNEKSGQSFPIQLHLLPNSPGDTPCGSDAFNSPLEKAPPKLTKSKPKAFKPGKLYREIEFAGEKSIELLGKSAGIDAINKQLSLSTSTEDIKSYYEQRRSLVSRFGYFAEDEKSVEPTFWSEHFISINFHTWVAGMGSNGISNERRTWDLKTGKEINISSWLAKFPVSNREIKKQRTENAATSMDIDCSTYRSKDQFEYKLTDNGLEIYEEARGDGCEISFTVPYRKLLPYLRNL